MKSLLIGINAKYIHPNLAIRLLKNNTTYQTDIIEYTTKENKDTITNYIIDNNYDFIGFSCYIWNINYIKELVLLLKEKKSSIKIMLGGPEVSYNANEYIGLVDYVIKNEGEESYHLLLSYLDNKVSLNEVPNLFHRNGYTFDKLVDIKSIKPAYGLIEDVENRIIYFETSRGCPYHCSYCMASLDNKVRFFDIEQVKIELKKLLDRKAKVIKFLDRTFNANKKNFVELIDFLILHHKPYNSFQFEITGDLLDEDLIHLINEKAPKNLFRFEIGIQSTNVESNLLVKRIQNNQKLFHNITLIQNAKVIDLHLDLIAGLPKEDYNSFKNTFNEVLSLRPKELQLGFLKLLHGTVLKQEHTKYNYIYNKTAPYEIISNDSMSISDIKNIHICEDAFEKFYNYGYMDKSIQFILDNTTNYFDFFFDLGNYYLSQKINGLDTLFLCIDNHLKETNFNKYDEAHILLLIDYLKYNNVKAKSWWTKLDKKEKTEYIRYIDEIKLTPFTIEILYKYSTVIRYKKTLIIALYINNKSYVYTTKAKD